MSLEKYDNNIVKKGEMVYGNSPKTEVLADGTYKGFKVCILSYGTHPCCYFKLNDGDKFIGTNYDDIPLDCHGGITFFQKTDSNAPMGEGYWLGWDYGHYGDAYGTMMPGRKYTTDLLIADLKQAIDEYICL